jgi:RNA polymerase sigma factor (sigma-70 family)
VLENNPEQLTAFREGEPDVLRALYIEHVHGIGAILRAGFTVSSGAGPKRVPGIRSLFEVEELCQEVFERAFKPSARRRYDGIRPFRSYLFAIAKNLRIDQLRRGRLQIVSTTADLGCAPIAEQMMARKQLKDLVQAFVRSLATQDERWYKLRYRDGLGQMDAALVLGIGRTTGRALDASIRRRLVAFLSRHGYP